MAKNQQVLIHPLAHWPWFQAHSFSRLVSRSTVQGVICVSGSTLCLCMHRTVSGLFSTYSIESQKNHFVGRWLIMLDLWVCDVRIPWDIFDVAVFQRCAEKRLRFKTLRRSHFEQFGGSSKAKTKRKSEDETIFSTTSLLGRGQLTGGYEDIVQLLCYKLMFFFRIPNPPLLPTCKKFNQLYIDISGWMCFHKLVWARDPLC